MRKSLFKVIIFTLLVLVLSFLNSNSTFAQSNCPAIPTNTGKAILSADVIYPGNYRVWSRIKAADNTNNSFYLQIDNQCPVLVGDSSQISNTSWTWVDYQNGDINNKINLNLTAGSHVLTLIGNENNVGVDKILLTQDINCLPTNFGTNCPSAVSPTLAPSDTTTPTLTPSNSPTLAPSDTTTPTLTPSNSPTPQPTSTPIPTDTIKPTISFLAPLNNSTIRKNSTFYITMQATDNVAVSRIEVYTDNNLICQISGSTLYNQYQCPWKVSRFGRSDSTNLTAVAYDTSNNKSNVSISVRIR